MGNGDMAARTSETHPLRIAELPAGAGRIGLSLCPGKYQADAWTGAWARDLDVDLDAVRAWGADAVVTLVEAHELRALRVEGMGGAVAARGMRWFHLPIRDYHAPCARFEADWAEAGRALRALLRSGGRVFVHCKGGLGRAGTVSARLLVELGEAPDAAVRAVRAARRGAIETGAQEAHVRALAMVAE